MFWDLIGSKLTSFCNYFILFTLFLIQPLLQFFHLSTFGFRSAVKLKWIRHCDFVCVVSFFLIECLLGIIFKSISTHLLGSGCVCGGGGEWASSSHLGCTYEPSCTTCSIALWPLVRHAMIACCCPYNAP